jgi:broad specificity phosphatase PhoE
VALIRFVRHGRAAAGWSDSRDPSLDDVGRAQAAAVARELAGIGPVAIVTSPLARCRETAAAIADVLGVEPEVRDEVAEIPSPAGVSMADRSAWLRDALAARWTDLGEPFGAYRDALLDYVRSITVDTVCVTHFVAINAVIGAATGDDRLLVASLDNCSVTTIDVAGSLTVVSIGREADTLIR